MQFSEYVLRSVSAKADSISKGINEVYLHWYLGHTEQTSREVALLQSRTLEARSLLIFSWMGYEGL